MASAPAAPAIVAPSLAERLDGYVERAQAAATSFRDLSQEQVDRIVWAMVVAGLRNAVELAQLAALPSKFMPAPGYTAYVAPERYAQIAWIIGLGGRSEEERCERLFRRVEELLDEVGMPRSLEAAFEDASIRTNPRIPLVHELTDLLEEGFHGR